jgi:TPR repeat protein
MFLLATFFEQGFGVAKDDVEAARWYRAAADKGDPGAMFALSQMYRDGCGVPKDQVESERWWSRSQEAMQARLKSSGDPAPLSGASPLDRDRPN